MTQSNTFLGQLLVTLTRTSPAFDPVTRNAKQYNVAGQLLIALARTSPAFTTNRGKGEGTTGTAGTYAPTPIPYR